MFRNILPLVFFLAANVFAQNRELPQAPPIQPSAVLNQSGSQGDVGQSHPAAPTKSPTPSTRDRQAATGPLLTLTDAIQLAISNNPNLKAAHTQIDQSEAQEITEKLRPNPTLSADSQFLPIFVNLNALIGQYGRYNGMDQLLIAVHPRHERFYKRFFAVPELVDERS